MKVNIVDFPTIRTTSQEMKIGQVAVIRDAGFSDTIILRTYNGFVSLKNPSITWGPSTSFFVEILPPGTKIELVTE